MTKLLQWLKSSVEGIDGKASARSLTNFWYVGINTAIAVCIIVLCFQIVHQQHPTQEGLQAIKYLIYLCIIFNVTILVIFGIVSFQQLTEGVRAIRGMSPDPVFTETKTSTTVTEIKPKANEIPIQVNTPVNIPATDS